MKERSKKDPSIESKPEHFIRLRRVTDIPNNHHVALQIEKITVVGDKVVKREPYGHPDIPEMVLAKVSEALNPESALCLDSVVA